MAIARILVVEDDDPIRRGITDALTISGYETIEAADGESGLQTAVGGDPDLVLLDVLLPGMNGFEVLTQIRGARPNLPVIMLTARGTEQDRVRGLKGGADDYVVKPFSATELLARVEALLRRCPARPSGLDSVTVGGRRIDFERREITRPDGCTTILSQREIDLLGYLVANRGRAVSREELLERVWGIDPRGVHTRTVDMHIARLRETLADDPASPQVIITVRSKGYMLAAPPAEQDGLDASGVLSPGEGRRE